MLALLASLLMVRPAAAQTCALSNFVANPSLPTTLYVRNNYAVNDRVFVTTITANFSCSSPTVGKTIVFGAPVQSFASTTVATGLRYVTGANATAGPNTGAMTITSGTSVCQAGIAPSVNKPYLTFLTTGSCSGTVTIAIAFIASAASPSGSIPAILPPQPAGVYSSMSGWISAALCDGTPSCGFVSVLASLPAPNAITLSTITSSCTLSSYNLTATLPTVSRSAFSAGVGSTAGRTLLPLTISCPSGLGSTGLSLGISFNPATDATTGLQIPTAVASTGTATNVAVRLYDSSGNALVSGSAARITNAIAAGTYSSVLSASYVSIGTPVGAGSVNSTATIFLEYF